MVGAGTGSDILGGLGGNELEGEGGVHLGCGTDADEFLAFRWFRSVVGVVGHAPVIEYDGTFTFPVPVARVWEMMGRFSLFPSWWGWLREFSVEGHELARGTVLHGVVVPPLPYQMRLDVALDECVPRDRVAASVHGDLEGWAQLTFEGGDSEALVHAMWAFEMMQPPMRMAARFAHPLLRWGHDCVVEATVEGFRRHVVDGAPP